MASRAFSGTASASPSMLREDVASGYGVLPRHWYAPSGRVRAATPAVFAVLSASTACQPAPPDPFPREHLPPGSSPLPLEVRWDVPTDVPMDADFDGDGVPDHAETVSGHVLGRNNRLELTPGTTLWAETTGFYGGRTNLALLDVSWRTPKLMAAAGRLLFRAPVFVRLENASPLSVDGAEASVHPATAWVHDAIALPPVEASEPVLRAGAWVPRWDPGPPTPAPAIAALVTLPSVLRAANADFDPRFTRSDVAILWIGNAGLDKLAAGPRCGARQLYYAQHGVAVYDTVTDSSAWIWVSGVPGVSPMGSLTWRSVDTATCLDDDLVALRVYLDDSHHRTFVVDPTYARWVELQVNQPLDLADLRQALTPRVADLDGDGEPDPLSWRSAEGDPSRHVPTVNLSRSGAVELPVSLQGDTVGAPAWGGARHATPLVHGTCGPTFEEDPLDRCFIGQVDGMPVLLLRETDDGADAPPDEAERRKGIRSAWRQFTFPAAGGYIQSDWGAPVPVE